MSKRKGAPSSLPGAPVPVADPRLLPRIHEYLDSLDPDVEDITPAAIVEHLRKTFPEYARKPEKSFARSVEALCEKMREEALAEDQQMQDTVDAMPTPTASTPAADATPTVAPTTASSAATASPHKKRRKTDSTNGVAENPIAVSSDDEESDSSEEEKDVIDLDFVETKDANLANNNMRGLYTRAAPMTPSGEEAASASTTALDATAKKRPRENSRKAKEENVALTTNSKNKMSAKKKAQRAKNGPVSNVHFRDNPNSPDDMTGAGGNWDPEVLRPTSTYADLGGIEGILQEIRELVEYPLTHPEIYRHLGIQPPRGVLLHGPPGCGKTCLAHAIAGELNVPFLKISAPEVVSGMSGESEEKIRTLFNKALDNAPCLLFIDEIDAITPKRSNSQRQMEHRIVAQLLTCMDSLSTSNSGDPNKIVIVIGATNRPDSLDSALRRAGRFDREIALGIPDEAARARILQVMCRGMRLEEGIRWEAIAKAAVGYVGADLMALTREAAVIAINRIFRTVLPTPSLKPAGEPVAPGALPPLSLATASPKLNALMPAAAPAVASAAAAEIKAGLNAAAAAAAASPTATAAASPAGAPAPGTVPHVITDAKSAAAQAELSSRGRASQKLRAQAGPLSEELLAPLRITHADFQAALKKVQPSSKREGFATVPDVSWNDIGALDDLREELSMTILQPILNPQQFEAIGLTVPAGVLLFGPPGCGKTLVAKAIANESGASFLSVKGPELLNQYVGQSERAVRKVFERAKQSLPCVIFFDELDALVPKRGSGSSEGNNVSERVVNQLLTEMDGLEERRGIFLIAATNRPDIIDPAMLRPGRLDKLLYVKLPTAAERGSILRKHLRRTPLAAEVDVAAIAADPRAEGFSGADCAALVREATLQALREAQQKQREEKKANGIGATEWASMRAATNLAPSTTSPSLNGSAAAGTSGQAAPLPVLVGTSHFHFAFGKVFPSVSAASRAKYDRMHRALSRARATLNTEGATGTAETIVHAASEIEGEETKAAAAAAAFAATASASPVLAPMSSASALMPPPASRPPAHGSTILSTMTAKNAPASSAAMDTQ